MKNSCGAIFYSHDNYGTVGVILGEEGKEEWLPFKGCAEDGEELEHAAIREIKEETCGLVCLDSIKLEHKFSSKRKNYYIGLCYVPFSLINDFEEKLKAETRKEFKEKKRLRFFPLESALQSKEVHNISKASIEYFWDKIKSKNTEQLSESNRFHGISEEYAKYLFKRQ